MITRKFQIASIHVYARTVLHNDNTSQVISYSWEFTQI